MKQLLLAMGLLIVLAACTTAPSTTPTGEVTNSASATGDLKEFEILAYNWGFKPAVVTVQKGDLVRLKFVGKDSGHGVAIPEFGVMTQPFMPGETQTIEFVADKAGKFMFLCNVYCGRGHSEMMGQLVVTQ